MPCLNEERFLLLERSLAARPQHDVDALVARIGQALQLGRPGAPPEGSPAPPAAACGCVRGRAAPYALCARQHRGPPGGAAPHGAPAPGGKKQLCGRGWIRSAAPGREPDDEDPHRLLQQLLLSGNLIKEAVRRLQLAAGRAEPVQ